MLLLFLIAAILGVQLFGGALWSCNDPTVATQAGAGAAGGWGLERKWGGGVRGSMLRLLQQQPAWPAWVRWQPIQ